MALTSLNREELQYILKSRIESTSAVSAQIKNELTGYLEGSLERLFFTFNLLKKYHRINKGRVLEIGPYPFFLTALLLEKSDDEIVGMSAPNGIWPGENYQVSKEVKTLRMPDREYRFDCWSVNAEKDLFPFEDESFDVVICAEVIEHLVHTPCKMVHQINRVLKNNGLLILTTPNGLFWYYIFKLIFYGSWEPFSKYGIYGRHNRLWAPNEIRDILTLSNFSCLEIICNYGRSMPWHLETNARSGVAHIVQEICWVLLRALVKIPIPFLKKKDGDQLYCVAKKTGPPKFCCPDYLRDINFISDVEHGI